MAPNPLRTPPRPAHLPPRPPPRALLPRAPEQHPGRHPPAERARPRRRAGPGADPALARRERAGGVLVPRGGRAVHGSGRRGAAGCDCGDDECVRRGGDQGGAGEGGGGGGGGDGSV